ncbi:hypothetical protein HDF24_08775 [Mucilaginibacter sp. X4EP1]|uniref:hypothetical protein n=1 Tax=Mucilaginibacter sp. X4EP1 TaxID=2723092 RepID=UPI00216A2FC7|nr:hypothetical protein [Mucilaginibacter sp. X4EP1]MCS3813763.1 hypothetical protein [Mucilaginibacter sp. X4EP1]
MRSTIEIIEILNKILVEDEPFKSELIVDFQTDIFKDESIVNESLDEIISDLAYDLDFYEPKEELRKQDSSFYNNERLAQIIKASIIKINNYNEAFYLKPAANE